jgi:lipopolysaccharide/colanic/teichoic acid biosynthesis glycosyltransferase
LPQLWNVVRGDIGIVGPPPVDPASTTRESDRDRPEDRPGDQPGEPPRDVPPGLTGMWGASGRRGASGAPPA